MAAGKGDARLEKRAEMLLEAIVEKRSVVLRAIGGGRAGEIAAGRFLGNDAVTIKDIMADAARRTLAAASGRSVLAIHDTTEVNFSGSAGRRKGLGPAGDGESPGFFCHPLLVVDVEEEAVLGLASAEIWTRAPGKVVSRKQRAIDEKESARWGRASQACAEIAEVAARVVGVADSEADLYEHFLARPIGVEMIVRARHDRRTVDSMKLFETPKTFPPLGTAELEVAVQGPGDRKRRATVSIKAGRVALKRPDDVRSGPESLTLGLVEIAEIAPPEGQQGVCWRLLTTLPVTTLAQASEVAHLYRLRWRIEQLFRTFKTAGLDIEASQVCEAARMLKLAALGLVAASRIMQLVDARDGSSRPASDIVEASDLPAVAAISRSLEGGTARQKNPHPQGSLAFLSWVTARLGGWTGYYRPPGPKTMATGLLRLNERLEGYRLAMATKDV
jgi:ribosomal protein S11